MLMQIFWAIIALAVISSFCVLANAVLSSKFSREEDAFFEDAFYFSEESSAYYELESPHASPSAHEN